MKPNLIISGMTILLIPFSVNAELHDRGGGLIYDDVLDVTWLQDTNYGLGTIFDGLMQGEIEVGPDNHGTLPDNYGVVPDNYGIPNDGKMNWHQAVKWADTLEYYDNVRGVSWDDWRLPKIACWVNGVNFNRQRETDGSTDVGLNITSLCHELSYMYYVNFQNKASKDTSGNTQADKGLIDNPDNDKDESMFIGFFDNPKQKQYFWNRTLHQENISNAFGFRTDNGNVAFGNLQYQRKAWAVRDGDVGLAPEKPLPNISGSECAVFTEAQLLARCVIVGNRQYSVIMTANENDPVSFSVTEVQATTSSPTACATLDVESEKLGFSCVKVADQIVWAEFKLQPIQTEIKFKLTDFGLIE